MMTIFRGRDIWQAMVVFLPLDKVVRAIIRASATISSDILTGTVKFGSAH
jgi:hypothetical protein